MRIGVSAGDSKGRLAAPRSFPNRLTVAAFATATMWMAVAPRCAWGQSAVWLPLGATSGNIYYDAGNVGIGTPNPQYQFDVAGALFPSMGLYRPANGVDWGAGLNLEPHGRLI